MNVEPCNVCGGTDVNLVDGFYYCVECGTQDVNVRETVIEDRALADGTFTIRRHNKVTIAAEETQELSGEWHKWHAYNFILSGMADDLIAAGAKPTFKTKLLWLWTKYIKLFQNKEELGLNKEDEDDDKENDEQNPDSSKEEDSDNNGHNKKKKKTSGYRSLKMTTDLSVMKRGLLFCFIHAALNLDGSEIQPSDLFRFIREGRVDFDNCCKYVPEGIKFRLVPQWDAFVRSSVGVRLMRITAISLFKCLNVVPVLPDLRLIVDRFIKELCLPKDFRSLVISLMDLVPCDIFLDIDRSVMKTMLRIPPYETTIMGYILVAFKLCFGLDDNYDVKVSDAVERINDENCYLKSYKLGEYSEPTDRLFSFREWCTFIQLRKIILCKYNLHLAEQYALDIDDYVYMEQCKGRKKEREPLLSDEITMNMLEKIPLKNTAEVIPKSEFKATLTPLSTYTDVVLQYFKDPDLRLLFSEDFTQYSLKYACQKLHLNHEDDLRNIILGVDDTKKVINKAIFGKLEGTKHDSTMVYVRDCQNKNWLKTKQPSVEHVQKAKKNSSDRESDHGYDSNMENTSEIEISSKDEVSSNHELEANEEEKEEVERKLEIIEEEDIDKNIFDDDFENLVLVEDTLLAEDEIKSEEPDHIEDNIPQDINSFHADPIYDVDDKDDSEIFFNPDTFDRSRTIKELVLATCIKHKIRIPDEYNTKEPKKRKSKLVDDAAGESGAKRRKTCENRQKTKRGEATDTVNKLIADYYNNLQHDVMFQISEHVKSVINNVSQIQDEGTDEIDLNTDRADGDADLGDRDDVFPDEDNRNDDTADKSSLQIIENEDDDDERPQDDPRFNEKEYDIKQLYVKAGDDDESDSDDLFGIAKDPELIAILDKKIEEQAKGVMPETAVESPKEKETFDSDDDDDVPLSVLKEEIISMHQLKDRHRRLPKLISNQEHITEFKYWTRFYASEKMRKMYDLNEPFELDLNENFPVSFQFVIRECAGILDCSPYLLYKVMVMLEQRILSHSN